MGNQNVSITASFPLKWVLEVRRQLEGHARSGSGLTCQKKRVKMMLRIGQLWEKRGEKLFTILERFLLCRI